MSRYCTILVSEYTDDIQTCTSHPGLEYCVKSNHSDDDPAQEVLVEFEGNKPKCLYGKTEVTKSQILASRADPTSKWYVEPEEF